MKRFHLFVACALAASGCVALNDYSQFTVRDGGGRPDDAEVDAGVDAGFRCQSDGDCVGATPSCDAVSGRCVACPPPDRTVDRLEPIVHVMLPSGGSVTNPFGVTGITIWQALQDLFRDPANPIVRLQFGVRFGITLYTAQTGVCPIVNTVPPLLGNAGAIQNAVATTTPGLDIPGPDVMSMVTGNVLAADPAGVAYVHFVPNVPDTCAVPNPNMAGPEMVAAATAALSGYGIRSYAIGLDDLALAFTPQLAAAGTGETSARYWDVRAPAGLAAAFEEALRLAAPCRIALTSGTLPAIACDATVSLGGSVLTCNDVNGWRPIDATTFELLGTSCTTLQNDAALVPTVSVLCPAN